MDPSPSRRIGWRRAWAWRPARCPVWCPALCLALAGVGCTGQIGEVASAGEPAPETVMVSMSSGASHRTVSSHAHSGTGPEPQTAVQSRSATSLPMLSMPLSMGAMEAGPSPVSGSQIIAS